MSGLANFVWRGAGIAPGAILVQLAAALCSSASAQPRQFNGADLERMITAVGQVVSPAGESKETRGSGVVISPQGLVITCNHVLGRGTRNNGQVVFEPTDAKGIFKHPDPKSALRLDVVRIQPEYDLALLQIRGYVDGRPLVKGQSFPSLPIGRAEDLRLLDVVYVIGFPEVGGDTVTVIEGRIAGKDSVNRWLKLDASVSGGYSGGAVVNGRGELVGVPTEIRADIQDVRGDKTGARNGSVLYGFLSWVRPAELVSRLLTSPSEAPMTPASNDPAVGLIQGTVVSDAGAPLADAIVGLLKPGSTVVTQDNLLTYVRSDAVGGFVLRTAPGKYTLRTHRTGYRTASQPVSLSDTLHLRISLTRQPDPPAPAPAGKPHDK